MGQIWDYHRLREWRPDGNIVDGKKGQREGFVEVKGNEYEGNR